MIPIKLKLSIAMLAVALIPLTTFGVLNYHQTKEVLSDSVEELLVPLLHSKESVLEEYLSTTEEAAQSIAGTSVFQKYASYLNKPLTDEDLPQYNNAEEQVKDILQSFQKVNWGKYHHVFVVDQSGTIVLSPSKTGGDKLIPTSHLDEDASTNKWLKAALTQGETQISDYSSWTESDHYHQMLFYPVKDQADDVMAVIGFELQIPYEQELLVHGLEWGEDSVIYMTTLEGVPIFYRNTNEVVPENVSKISDAVSEGFSFSLTENSEGTQIVEIYLRHEKHPWVIVAKVPTKEVRGVIQSTFIPALIITSLVVIVFALLLSNLIVKPINKLTESIEAISMGKFDVVIEGKERSDEIGKLAQAFDRTVVSLKLAMSEADATKNNDSDLE